MVHFNEKLEKKKKKTFNSRVRVKNRITETFLFFCNFGDRDGDSIMGIKQKQNKTKQNKNKNKNKKTKTKQKQKMILYDEAILSL